MDSVRTVFQSHEIRREIGQQILKSGGTDDDLSKTIETFFNAVGISVVYVSAENLVTKVEPDRRLARIRLPDKTSRLRPRHVAPKREA
jgi:hypothetical protein